MNENAAYEKKGLFRTLEKFLPIQKAFAWVFGWICMLPSNNNRVPFLNTSPQGLRLIHAADHPAEADLLRQVLAEAGFHVEYVPSIGTGVFGTQGNRNVYVHESQADEAAAFLAEYMNATPETT